MGDADRIAVRVNGEALRLVSSGTLEGLVLERGFALESVAVAVNEEVLPRSLWPAHSLQDGDVVEIVRAVGGG